MHLAVQGGQPQAASTADVSTGSGRADPASMRLDREYAA
jgi:hypothetical protein